MKVFLSYDLLVVFSFPCDYMKQFKCFYVVSLVKSILESKMPWSVTFSWHHDQQVRVFHAWKELMIVLYLGILNGQGAVRQGQGTTKKVESGNKVLGLLNTYTYKDIYLNCCHPKKSTSTKSVLPEILRRFTCIYNSSLQCKNYVFLGLKSI